jgi:hypothetical protein
MAQYSVVIDGLALVAATAKTVIELGTASTDRAKLIEWWVDFDGVTSTAIPGKVEVGRATAAVTTATTATAEKRDAADGASTVVAKHSTTVEGAGTMTPYWIKRIHPQGGSFHYQAIDGSELVLAVSTFFRIRCTFAAAVNVTAGVIWQDM